MGGFRPAFSTCILRALITLLLFATPIAAFAEGWQYPHADAANSGYVGVMTAPAGAGSRSVPNIGTFAPGAGPVIAPDGTVYIGNEQGRLMAFRADGTPVWNVGLSDGEAIRASPLIVQGNIFVVAASQSRAAVYKFDASGNQLFNIKLTPFRDRIHGIGAPNILSAPYSGMVVVPITFRASGAPIFESHLFGIAEAGYTVLEAKIDLQVPSATGGFGSASIAPDPNALPRPFPMAAVYQGSLGDIVVVADGLKSLVGFRYSQTYLFTEIFRYTDPSLFHAFTATPAITSYSPVSVYADSPGGLMTAPFSQGDTQVEPQVHGANAPTLISADTMFLVSGKELIRKRGAAMDRVGLAGESVVSPAASQQYLYVSSANAFTTFDIQSLQQVARFDWVGGGSSPPAIGPKGHVYAIASNILFIFPPPKTIDTATLLGQPVTKTFDAGGNASAPPTPPQPTSTLPPTQLYDPPMTANGNRLFACEELDGDDCGKGDHRAISLAWCQAQGYAKVSGFDVDSRKVKAETLSGQFCSKNKCKVFDSIGCEM